MTLKELRGVLEHTAPLYDSPTGLPVEAYGIPDDPADYEVIGRESHDGDTFALVRGPSGDLDIYGPEAGQLHRDAIDDETPTLRDWLSRRHSN